MKYPTLTDTSNVPCQNIWPTPPTTFTQQSTPSPKTFTQHPRPTPPWPNTTHYHNQHYPAPQHSTKHKSAPSKTTTKHNLMPSQTTQQHAHCPALPPITPELFTTNHPISNLTQRPPEHQTGYDYSQPGHRLITRWLLPTSYPTHPNNTTHKSLDLHHTPILHPSSCTSHKHWESSLIHLIKICSSWVGLNIFSNKAVWISDGKNCGIPISLVHVAS